jgi:Fur family transcriptional regulator, zinc uptake regulator
MCHHEPRSRAGLKGAALNRALEAAERRCGKGRGQLTKPRRRVLQLLLQADGAVKGYDLIAAFGPRGRPSNPPTVYRALEYLGAMGLAHRLESLNAFVACRLEGAGHQAGFLICDCCGATQEFEPDFAAERALATQAGYAVGEIKLEAHGRCAACRV